MSGGEKINVISWSGGKDSTATIILAHELGIKIDLVIICLVYFDKRKKIYADSDKNIEWILNYAKPLFESWGCKVVVLDSDHDYYYWFYKIRKKSKYPENVGKYYGFLMGGACCMQDEKVIPIHRYYRELKKKGINYTEYVGICADEPKRIEKMKKRKNQRSLLVELGKTQADAKEKCKQYNLLSPQYSGTRRRGGCWFCPNQSIAEFAELKQNEPTKYNALKELSKVKNTVARGFMYGKPFEQVNAEVDAYIANPPAVQLSLFDYI